MKRRADQEIRFGLCIVSSEPDLELGKVYQILPDEPAAESNYVRIIDESGEAYLYPAGYLVSIELPRDAERALLQAS